MGFVIIVVILQFGACRLCCRRGWSEFRVQAFTFFAIGFLDRLAQGFGAAISTIVQAPGVVITVVAVPVAFVLCVAASNRGGEEL